MEVQVLATILSNLSCRFENFQNKKMGETLEVTAQGEVRMLLLGCLSGGHAYLGLISSETSTMSSSWAT